MPEIELIPEVYYQPMDPYHVHFDNLPLKNIITRQELINDAVDINSDILREAIGTQGTLSNRLNQSLNDDGSLKESAVDETLHNIAFHTDGSIVISGTPIDFVRMLGSERDKLTLISDGATALKLQVPNTPSTTVLFEDDTVILNNSSTVTWAVQEPNTVTANLAFPSEAAHRHYYDQTPISSNILSPDYINYKSTSIATPYLEGSLRVFINGIKLSQTDNVYVPASTGPNETWTLTSYTEDYADGLFALNRAITADDVIRIDFDIQL